MFMLELLVGVLILGVQEHLGSKADLSLTNQLRTWSIDNFGDDTLAAPRGGPIYFWDESTWFKQLELLYYQQNQVQVMYQLMLYK